MDFLYEIKVPGDETPHLTLWCYNHFGPIWNSTINPQGTWVAYLHGWGSDDYISWIYAFKNEKDATLFALQGIR